MRLLKTLRAMRTKGAARPAKFVLLYQPSDHTRVEVGELTFDGTAWAFAYSDDYRRHEDLRPIEGFPDLDRVYRSTVLFPFFAVRVPDAEREDVKRKLQADRVQDPEPSDLLRIFGRRVVSSPAFELVPA